MTPTPNTTKPAIMCTRKTPPRIQPRENARGHFPVYTSPRLNASASCSNISFAGRSPIP